MKRSRVQIHKDILELLREGPRAKTQIVYSLNLNFRSCHDYIDELEKARLIEKMGREWRITPRGQASIVHLRASGLVP
jgi:predicted transcriptional regulator